MHHISLHRGLPAEHAEAAALTAATLGNAECTAEIRAYFSLIPRFGPTPLISLRALARELGISELWIKDERNRMGLASFKGLGGTHAVLKLVADILSKRSGKEVTPADVLRKQVPSLDDLTVTTATAGNHGRAVAFGAQLAGVRAIIFVYDAVPEDQISAIVDHGAEVVRVPGLAYECAFKRSLTESQRNGWHLVSDVARQGYEDIPMDIMHGYTIIAREALEQLPASPTHVFAQAGVGGLAAPLISYLSAHAGGSAKYIVVESDNVPCLMESARAGRPISRDSDRRTIMGRLDVATPGSLTWPLLALLSDAFVAVSDDLAREAVSALSRHGFATTPTGAAGLAGVIYLLRNKDARRALCLDGDSRVLAVATEQSAQMVPGQNNTGQNHA